MTTSRDALVAKLEDPGFTPSVRTLDTLLELVGRDEEHGRAAVKAVLKIEAQYAARVAQKTLDTARGTTSAGVRARLTQLAGRLVREKRDPDGVLRGWLFEALEDRELKIVRAAARALGNLDGADVKTALEAANARLGEEDPIVAEALARQGGAVASGGRAELISRRERARGDAAMIDGSRAPVHAIPIWFHTRSGLEEVVREELGIEFSKTTLVAPGVVEGTLSGPLGHAGSIRTATHVGLPLPAVTRTSDVARDIIAGLRSATDTLRTFSSDPSAPIRFRVAFRKEQSKGQRRSIAWRVAELAATELPGLVNDPRDSTWEVVVDEIGSAIILELVPRGLADDRFPWRTDLVAAASHPTVAAALARVAPRREDDVVWDPFVGSGAELVERARLGPYARLIGTDTDAAAVRAARANLARAEVGKAYIEQADATAFRPDDVSLVITNPPMGRRIARGDHADLLDRFLVHVTQILRPGGALVWLVPNPKPIQARAEALGLERRRAFTVDMGGFPAELVTYVMKMARPARPSSRLSRRRR